MGFFGEAEIRSLERRGIGRWVTQVINKQVAFATIPSMRVIMDYRGEDFRFRRFFFRPHTTVRCRQHCMLSSSVYSV
jgi:hypothetical protein